MIYIEKYYNICYNLKLMTDFGNASGDNVILHASMAWRGLKNNLQTRH